MKIEINTTPVYKKIKILIDNINYSNIITDEDKREIVSKVRQSIFRANKALGVFDKGIPKSISIKPNDDECKKCSAIHFNCAKNMFFLHGNIEVCKVLYDLILEHKFGLNIPNPPKVNKFKFTNNGKIEKIERE